MGDEAVADQGIQKDEQGKKDEQYLSPEEIFDAAFGEAIDADTADKAETDEQDDTHTDTSNDDDTATQDEGGDTQSEEAENQETSQATDATDDTAQQGDGKAEEQPPAKVPEQEATQEPPKQAERTEEPAQQAQQPTTLDFTPLFADLANDIDDPESRREVAEYEAATANEPEGRLRKLQAERILNFVNESFKVLVENIKPALTYVTEQMQNGRSNAIAQAHSDYEQLKKSGEVLEWIKGQPRYLQASLKQAFEAGDPEDIVDLLTRYKTEKGIGAQQADQTGKDEAKEKSKAKIREKVESLGAVKTKDRPVHIKQKPSNKDDFDAAFDEAVSRR